MPRQSAAQSDGADSLAARWPDGCCRRTGPRCSGPCSSPRPCIAGVLPVFGAIIPHPRRHQTTHHLRACARMWRSRPASFCWLGFHGASGVVDARCDRSHAVWLFLSGRICCSGHRGAIELESPARPRQRLWPHERRRCWPSPPPAWSAHCGRKPGAWPRRWCCCVGITGYRVVDQYFRRWWPADCRSARRTPVRAAGRAAHLAILRGVRDAGGSHGSGRQLPGRAAAGAGASHLTDQSGPVLLSVVSARDFRLGGTSETVERLEATIATMEARSIPRSFLQLV